MTPDMRGRSGRSLPPRRGGGFFSSNRTGGIRHGPDENRTGGILARHAPGRSASDAYFVTERLRNESAGPPLTIRNGCTANLPDRP
ncbi:MAG: hypothetical protein A9Z00_10615 [Thermobacillus sp. ZCTH02-B1]|nr:MAG: hypothetical protein A9Z00_10615 [Thermobacillus sp. ZCTH02-B1]